jgi:hypothetical protein
MKLTLLLSMIGTMLLFGPAVAAADVTLRWSEIASTVEGIKATVVLTNGNKVKGTVTRVQPDALLMEPNQDIPRATVAQFRIRKNRIKGRVIGTTVGIVIGGFGAAAGDVGSAGSRVAAALIYAGGGYLIGYAIDRHEIVINIAQDVASDGIHAALIKGADTFRTTFEQ